MFQIRVGNVSATIDSVANPLCGITTAADTDASFTFTSSCESNAGIFGQFAVIRKKTEESGPTNGDAGIFSVSEFNAVLAYGEFCFLTSMKNAFLICTPNFSK